MTSEQVVLITGASSGIGRAIAELLARKEFTVYGTSRTPGSPPSGWGAPLLPLDVRSNDSVEACVKAVLTRSGRLDVLVNNAGFALLGAAEETSLAEAMEQFDTNFFGAVRMTNAVLPVMREAGGGRIINVSSLAGLVAIPFGAFYSASKAALEGYSEALRHELKSFGIVVSLVEPAFVGTSLGEKGGVASSPIAAYEEARSRTLRVIQQSVSAGITPGQVAECVLRVIRSRSPRLRYRVGAAAIWLPRLKAMAPWRTFEAGVRRRFQLPS